MLGQCDECDDHGLKPEDFEKTLSTGHSDSDSEVRDLTEPSVFTGGREVTMASWWRVTLLSPLRMHWSCGTVRFKSWKNIFTKCQQQSKILYLKGRRGSDSPGLEWKLRSQDQNEIQSVYFGQASFSLSTACPYYRCSETNEIKIMPTTITSEASDKSRMAWTMCVKKEIDHVLSKIINKIDMVYIVSDGCASQFRSKFVSKLLTLIHLEIGLEWHFNEAHHGKGPMDGIGGTVKNIIFRKVLSGEVVIGSPEEFARYSNQICQVDSLYLPTAKILDVPEDVQYSFSVPDTLKTHRVIRGLSKHKIPYLKFYYMSTRWFGPECGHVENGQDENTCAFCLKSYHAVDNDFEWIKCPMYENWFHEQYFLVELLSSLELLTLV